MSTITKTVSIKDGINDLVIGDYTIRFTSGTNEYYVNVEAFQNTGAIYCEKDVDYDPPKLEYARKGATSGLDTTYNIDEAQRVISGSIKWDGCSDFDFFPDEGGNSHFCGKKSAAALGKLIESMYDLAKEVMGSSVVHDVDLYEG